MLHFSFKVTGHCDWLQKLQRLCIGDTDPRPPRYHLKPDSCDSCLSSCRTLKWLLRNCLLLPAAACRFMLQWSYEQSFS